MFLLGLLGGATIASFTSTPLKMRDKEIVASRSTVDHLRCESLDDPLGIDRAAPRLSWLIESHRRGDGQTAYHVLVASTKAGLASDTGDLWDSGEAASTPSPYVLYHGKPLTSRARCYWKVRVWDKDGHPSTWSAPAMWSMGLLQPSDWHAQWVEAAPISLGKSVTILKAIYGPADPRVNAPTVDVTTIVQAAMHDGALDFGVSNGNLGGDPAYGIAKKLHVDYQEDGQTLAVDAHEGTSLVLPADGVDLPYLRKSFPVSKTVARATLYATALGIYEIHINGRRVGDEIFAPGWTDYNKRIRYQAYDVTGLVDQGDNAIGALVGNGWYSGHIGNGGYQHYGKVPALLAQLEITYTDGSTDEVDTDASWKEHSGPIMSADNMMGESYDARREIDGWDKPGLDESTWTPVSTRQEAMPPNRPLDAQVSEPVRVLMTLRPKKVRQTAAGDWIFDLGQNMVGVARIAVDEPAGTKITIHQGEMLNPDGTLYTTNLRGAPSIDNYVTRGGGVETWQPGFTFHGFRYVELSGLTEKPSTGTVTGVVIGSATPHTGDFACSDPAINQLESNIQWGQRGNYLSVPTDCPQRDERMGWMGDAEVFVRTATFDANVDAFFDKWLVDVDDAQTPDGAFSDTSPSYGGGGTPAWADAGVICPWTIYLAYGDKELLRRQLPDMTRWVEWCRVHSDGLIRDRDRNGDYGDWLAIGADTPKDLIGTAYFAYSTHLLALSYQAVGDQVNAAKYQQLFEDIRDAFDKKYVAPNGRIDGDTQCGYAMALKFDLLPEGLRQKAADYLVDDIRSRGWHLSTGFVGVSYLLPVLTQAGRPDVAYRLLLQDTFPSWLFSVKQGATTIWERWDGWTPQRGFQDPGMNSFNHYALGSCGEWLFEGVAGIAPDPNHPAYEHVLIRPQMTGPLTWASARYDSVRGTISTKWKRDGRKLSLAVTIPPGTTATVSIPAENAGAVMESGGPAARSEGVKFVRYSGGDAVFNIESGSYAFTSEIAHPVAAPAVDAQAKRAEPVARSPRIVNIYNFVRENDFRLSKSEDVLYDATVQQIRLLKQAKLPATFALQYDALIDPRYQHLFKHDGDANFEIAAWWEIPQALVEKAGLTWRGKQEWDPEANVGFSPGYTPEERRKLVDVYMAEFKSIFGCYPRTVGSWYIDEVTLAYMAKRYGVIASCNCRDQIGTDFYTLWGGYWNQAYYPSRLNAYMPAQTRAGQIDIPIFRMLGSDPIYQHGPFTAGIYSLEPVYPGSGGSADWVEWFMRNLIDQPSLAFAYTQAGQENSFGWDAMKDGLTQQIALFAEQSKAGKIRVETLAQTGEWFRGRYRLTPPTAQVALDDWKNEDRKTVWYDSRFYRMNVLWQDGGFFIRDLHCFDENMVSPTHATALAASTLAYDTLPIMDWALWSPGEAANVGMWPVLVAPDGTTSAMSLFGKPVVKELNASDLSIEQPVDGGGTFTIVCRENCLAFTGVDYYGKPLRWAWRLVGGAGQKSVVQSVTPNVVEYRFDGVDYRLRLQPGSCTQLADGEILVRPNKAGKLVMLMKQAKRSASPRQFLS